MTFVIKRIRNRLYVYEQYREGNIVVTKYIGPLEKIARKYQLYMQGVNYMLTQRDIDWMKKEIAKEVVNMILDARNKGTEWRRGRDLNPGARKGNGLAIRRLWPSLAGSWTRLGHPGYSAFSIFSWVR